MCTQRPFTSQVISKIYFLTFASYIEKLPEITLKYTKYRNTLNSLLRASKKNLFSSQLNLHKNNMKKTWET